MYIRCNIITNIALVNTSILSHDYILCVCGGKFKIYALSNIQVYNTILLAIVTMLNISSPELVNLITGNVYPLINISPFPPTSQTLVTTDLLSVSMSSAFF